MSKKKGEIQRLRKNEPIGKEFEKLGESEGEEGREEREVIREQIRRRGRRK